MLDRAETRPPIFMAGDRHAHLWGAVNDSNNISCWVGGVSRAAMADQPFGITEVIVRTCSVSHPLSS